MERRAMAETAGGAAERLSSLCPGIYVLNRAEKDVDGRDEPGHDGGVGCKGYRAGPSCSHNDGGST
jgi:hypothetical protein